MLTLVDRAYTTPHQRSAVTIVHREILILPYFV